MVSWEILLTWGQSSVCGLACEPPSRSSRPDLVARLIDSLLDLLVDIPDFVICDSKSTCAHIVNDCVCWGQYLLRRLALDLT